MPDLDHDLIARLDALGERAAADVPAVPGALSSAVAARGAVRVVPRQRVPRVALGAAAAVVLAGAALVALRAPVVMRHTQPGWVSGSATVLAMTERFNRGASIDAAVETLPGGGASPAGGPVYRALDARTGQLPE